jgi:hypothetical protein
MQDWCSTFLFADDWKVQPGRHDDQSLRMKEGFRPKTGGRAFIRCEFCPL